MPVALVQANSFANGGNTTISLPFTSPNTAGNIGVVFCFTFNGEIPGEITDSQGNAWCFMTNVGGNVGQISCFLCKNLKAGANTVKAIFGDLPIGGTPSISIAEFSCTLPATFVALPTHSNDLGNILGAVWPYANYETSETQPYNAALFAAIYDVSSSKHQWGSNPSGVYAYNLESSGASNATAFIEFTTTPNIDFFDPSINAGKPYELLPICAFLVID